MTLAAGDRAPDFTLPSTGGEDVTLSHVYAGRTTVLFFYPKDDSPGCTIEACTFRDRYDTFAQAGAEVLGVSSDSLSAHAHFASKHRLPMRLLSDADGRVRALYGVRATLGLFPGRATFVIGKDGIVRHAFVSQVQFQKHVAQALEIVKGLGQDPSILPKQ